MRIRQFVASTHRWCCTNSGKTNRFPMSQVNSNWIEVSCKVSWAWQLSKQVLYWDFAKNWKNSGRSANFSRISPNVWATCVHRSWCHWCNCHASNWFVLPLEPSGCQKRFGLIWALISGSSKAIVRSRLQKSRRCCACKTKRFGCSNRTHERASGQPINFRGQSKFNDLILSTNRKRPIDYYDCWTHVECCLIAGDNSGNNGEHAWIRPWLCWHL